MFKLKPCNLMYAVGVSLRVSDGNFSCFFLNEGFINLDIRNSIGYASRIHSLSQFV